MATAPCCTRFGEFPVVYGFRGFGLGDWASDAYLATSVGQSALAAAKAAAALLPPGFTMGDPTSALWGASYYNGHKVIEVGQVGPGGQSYYGLDDGSLGPVVSDATNQAIQNAANAAYGVYSYIYGLRSSTNPDMVAVLSDPEWIGLQGQNIVWGNLSAQLQAKIAKVPNLYNQLTAGLNLAPETPSPPPAPSAPSGPATYLIAGITFQSGDGTVIAVNGQPYSGPKLTPTEVQSLLTTGALPSGDTFGKPIVPSTAPPTTNPTSQPTGPTSTTPQAPPTPVAISPSSPSDTSPSVPSVTTTLAAPTPTPVVADTTAAPSIFSSVPWYVWAGGAAVLLLSRKKS